VPVCDDGHWQRSILLSTTQTPEFRQYVGAKRVQFGRAVVVVEIVVVVNGL
jgi:hypothetical protein